MQGWAMSMGSDDDAGTCRIFGRITAVEDWVTVWLNGSYNSRGPHISKRLYLLSLSITAYCSYLYVLVL